MKYIKTKNGIHLRKIFDKEYSNKEWESLGYTIIKQADTIEELLDERVLTRYFDETKYTHHEILPENKWDMMAVSVSARLANGITDCNYYGAVWTDKGLIYVAKYTKDGEWELL